MRTVSALYIDPKGPYPTMPGVDCWDALRDATRYDGPNPVVAHPPCKNWSALRHLAHPGSEYLGIVAVHQVRKFGGVLEQPAYSKLWGYCGLAEPEKAADAYGFSIVVNQCSWGHVARKRTWLYIVGVDPALVRAGIRTGGTVTAWCSGGYQQGKRGCVPPGIRVASPEERRLTPRPFAEWLVSLARAVST